MYGTAEYVTLEYISEPKEALVRGVPTPVRTLVFKGKNPFPTEWVMYKIGEVYPIPEVGKEYHVDFALKSKVNRRNNRPIERRGSLGVTYATTVDMEFRAATAISTKLYTGSTKAVDFYEDPTRPKANTNSSNKIPSLAKRKRSRR